MVAIDFKEDAKGLHAFKELRFFLSHSVPLEIRCGISRLELPLGCFGDVGNHGGSDKRWRRIMSGAGGENVGGNATEEGFQAMMERLVAEEELVIAARVFSDGQPMHIVPLSSHTPSRYDPQRHAIIWDDVLCFPLRYRDLTRSTKLVITVWGVGDRLIGLTTMPFFDENGSLKMGLQKQSFQFSSKCPPVWDPAAPPLPQKIEGSPGWDDYSVSERTLSEDWGFRLERMKEKYQLGAVDRADWLDPASLARVEQLTTALADPAKLRSHKAYQSEVETLLRSKPFMVIELPYFAHPVIHEERPYPGVSAVAAAAAKTAMAAGGGLVVTPMTSPTSTSSTSLPTTGHEGIITGALGEGGNNPPWEGDVLGGGAAFLAVADYETEEDNPVEQKYRKLAHDQLRGLVDLELKPNLDERQRIDAIVSSHALGDNLKMEEKDLLWRFRYCLTDDKKALTKLLLSVDWGVEGEVAQVPGLLEQWRERAPIDVSDALKLLGRERTFQAEVVRRFAVDALHRASDEELLAFLLQLVQALRYQVGGVEAGVGGDERPGGGVGGGGAGTSLGGSRAQVLGGLAVLGGGDEQRALGDYGGWEQGVSPLAQFLIERACNSLELANFLYWYLRVDLEDATHGSIYRGVLAAFQGAMQQNPESAQVMEMLLAQDKYIQSVSWAHKQACVEKGRKFQKDEKLRELLQLPNIRRVPRHGRGDGGKVPMPLDPTMQITGLEADTAFMFRSALYPCVVSFTVKAREGPRPIVGFGGAGVGGEDNDEVSGGNGQRGSGGSIRSSSLGGDEGSVLGGKDVTQAGPGGMAGSGSGWLGQGKIKEGIYKVIIKSGDDLRQDQLIMQMISLMDTLLKRVNLDLRLRPYAILATGPKDGLVQFVSDSLPVSRVLATHNGSILDFLKHHNPDALGPYGVRASAVQTFVKSTAGYCVITYILGIGDRHLDNLMLLPAGNLFHIDFGYIFGRDPKPMAPPFRLTWEMVDAMGGVGSEHYMLFKKYCCQAYNWLRKSGNLILNLLNLMVDANISELSADPQAVLGKVEEKFRLDLTDEQAEQFFMSLIDESLRAFAPRVLEVMHQFAVARR